MTIPQLHMYDLKTGEYTSSRDATLRPNGEPILEATGATPVALPAVIPSGHIARWNGDAWETVEDHRQHMDERGRKEGGTPYWLPGDTWRSEPRYTEELGPLPEGALLERPKRSVVELRNEKLLKLNTAFSAAEASGHVMSSIGFEIDATERANRDVDGLITRLEATGMEQTTFCDYTNTFQTVTVANLKTMRLEIIAYGQALYARKWEIREAINAVSLEDEDAARSALEGIIIDFSNVHLA